MEGMWVGASAGRDASHSDARVRLARDNHDLELPVPESRRLAPPILY